MKRDHVQANTLSPAEVKEHPDERYYTHTARLTNSMRASDAQIDAKGSPYVEISAGDEKTQYAKKVEMGGPNSRAFPFMELALKEKHVEGMAILVSATRRAMA